MKIWNSYGSEHSANLVMIGSFKTEASAQKAKAIIDEVTDFICGSDHTYENSERYPDELMPLLEKLSYYPAPAELDQFRFDIHSKVAGNQIIITTDEDQVSGFLKLLIGKGARVEVYSAHDYPDTGEGRDTRE